MTGIVVVSHSAALAAAAIDLAREMAGDVRMVPAAGIASGFGTDATAITDAISAADDGQGVVIVMDLGSAIMSAEMALEFLDDDLRARVLLCPAPFVEGLVAGAVSASGGGEPAEVCRVAASALDRKRASLTADAHTRSFVLRNRHGLHARPAATLVAAIQGFDAEVELRNATRDSDWVDAGSLTQVSLLGGQAGDAIAIRATGFQAEQAIEAVVELAERGFGESAESHAITGPVWQYRHATVPRPMPSNDEPGRLDRARAVAREELERARDRVPDDVKAIFTAHLGFLDDVALLRRARVGMTVGDSAEDAWSQAIDATATDFARIQDPYLRAREVDVRAIGDSVLRALAGIDLREGHGIVVAPDLNPMEAATFDVSAAVLTNAQATDHAVMVLHARGIPVLLTSDTAVLGLADGTEVAVDVAAGTLTY